MGLMQPELTGLGGRSGGLRELHEQETDNQRDSAFPLTLPRPKCAVNKMRAVLLLLVVSLLTIKTVVGGKNKKERNKPSQYGSECTDWRYGNCVPSNGDCGAGLREGSCDQQTKKMKCKVPCNWKKDFGADCKYQFGSWGECDPSSGSRTRTGTLKKVLYNAECQQTISVSKPCPGKPRQKLKKRRKKTRGRVSRIRQRSSESESKQKQ